MTRNQRLTRKRRAARSKPALPQRRVGNNMFQLVNNSSSSTAGGLRRLSLARRLDNDTTSLPSTALPRHEGRKRLQTSSHLGLPSKLAAKALKEKFHPRSHPRCSRAPIQTTSQVQCSKICWRPLMAPIVVGSQCPQFRAFQSKQRRCNLSFPARTAASRT